VILTESMSPRMEGTGSGSEITVFPRRAWAKDGLGAATVARGVIVAAEGVTVAGANTVESGCVVVPGLKAGGASSACQSNMAGAGKTTSE